jgi:hypothetical protein
LHDDPCAHTGTVTMIAIITITVVTIITTIMVSITTTMTIIIRARHDMATSSSFARRADYRAI